MGSRRKFRGITIEIGRLDMSKKIKPEIEFTSKGVLRIGFAILPPDSVGC